jgi:RimJ/RimL family protein N-acetyltransferase
VTRALWIAPHERLIFAAWAGAWRPFRRCLFSGTVMSDTNGAIPDLTLETLSRNFFREAVSYGFTQIDYVRFVNRLLDLSMQGGTDAAGSVEPPAGAAATAATLPPGSAATLPLVGSRVTVRSFDPESDLSLLEAWIADPVGRYFLLSRSTSTELRLTDVVRSDDSALGIIALHDDRPIGCVAFLDIDERQRKAELRKLVGEPAERGRGYGKESSALWIRYGLTTLRLRKIYLNTLETNIGNIRLNEELGFRVEGILRNEVLIDGAYRDVLRMGLWRE